MSVVIRRLQFGWSRTSKEICLGLVETLQTLAPVGLDHHLACLVGVERDSSSVQTLVAVDEDASPPRVVGTASVLIERKFIHGGGKVGHIEDVAVRPDYQGEGVGRLLLEHAIAFCRERGCYKVILDCKEDVAPFYEKLGFRRHEIAMRLDLDLDLNMGGEGNELRPQK